MKTKPPQPFQSCVRALISGRVQGVGYRYSTRQKAIALNLTGWVRNLPDGRVEALIVGNPAQIRSLITWFDRGPAGAIVIAVDTKEERVQSFDGFEIRQ